jgi:hypothetical protein
LEKKWDFVTQIARHRSKPQLDGLKNFGLFLGVKRCRGKSHLTQMICVGTFIVEYKRKLTASESSRKISCPDTSKNSRELRSSVKVKKIFADAQGQ